MARRVRQLEGRIRRPGVVGVSAFTLTRTGVLDLVGLERLESSDAHVAIHGNAALTSLRALTGLTRAEHFSITDNPVLPTCDAEWLLGRTTWTESTVDGNDDDAVCPP